MEVSSVVGYHDVNNVKARELLQPHLGTNGFYLLRPSSDRKGGVLCTICVTNNNKLMNYRLARDPATRKYFIHTHTMFPNIQLLLAYYKTTPINAEVNTLLLHPVTPPNPRQQQQRHEEDGEDAYVVMERRPASSKEDDGTIPGLHEYLPKSEIGTVMNMYLCRDGSYLLRPSSTSEGQLTLAVSHEGRILNFKINSDGNQFYIAPKKRFNSVQSLLDYYRTSPIRSKKYGNQKILLLHPIPVDKNQEDMFKQKLEQKVAKKLSSTNLFPDTLPEPWQEHYDEHHKRCYYYNPVSGQSSWERPRAPPTSSTIPTPSQKGPKSSRSPSRSSSEAIQGRPLPVTPGSASSGDEPTKSRRNSDVTGSMSPRQKRAQQPLPAIPVERETTPETQPMRLSQRRNTENKRNFIRNVPDIQETPALPSKDIPRVPSRGGGRGALPALPPKEDSPSHVARSSNINRQPQMPLQEKPALAGTGGRFLKKGIPSLPPKDVEKGVPQLPKKQPNGSIPPLPPKEDSPPAIQEAEKPLPPLPPKCSSPSPPPKVHSPPSSIKKPKKIVEYEDFPVRQPPKSRMNVPPLPEKDGTMAAAPQSPPLPVTNGAPPPTPPTMNGGAPPPPPPPPVGVPVPPPPPLNAPPSNPVANRAPIEKRSQSISSEEGGRPFTANDLAQAKTLLKRRKEDSEEDKRGSAQNSGMANIFATAIDSRMMSIRKAMVDSDSGESEFEDVDDDWED